VNPVEAAGVIAAQTEHLKTIPVEALARLERAAREAAAVARAQAAQSRHSVSVRIVARHGGVRVTVQGPQATRYRALIERELNARIPDVKAEIRAQVTRKSR
jgi:hypothetical protein